MFVANEGRPTMEITTILMKTLPMLMLLNLAVTISIVAIVLLAPEDF